MQGTIHVLSSNIVVKPSSTILPRVLHRFYVSWFFVCNDYLVCTDDKS